MLGMEDWSVALAYWLNILAVLICVIYGAVNWNRGDDSALKRTPAGDNEPREENSK